MKNIQSNITLRIIILLTILFYSVPLVFGSVDLTDDEKAYIDSRGPIIAASIDGGAPLHFKNSKGEIDGIAVKTLESISSLTGLEFKFVLYDSINEAYESNADILFGLDLAYTRDNIIISKPYMKTKSILFMNSKLSSDKLDNEIFATIKGGNLPENVNEDNVLYYSTREDALDAVEKGEAGYGYGNEYSVSYYIIKNEYENIISIPNEMEERSYFIGLTYEDDLLLSIINKAIDEIDEAQMNKIILEVSSNIDKDVTLSSLLKTHGPIIFISICFVLLVLILIINLTIRAKKSFKSQSKRYRQLANISNECLFEYNVKTDKMTFSDKCETILGSEKSIKELKATLKQFVLSDSVNENVEIINIKLKNNQINTLKVVKSEILDNNGNKQYIIGKIIDISEEVAEKNELKTKSEIDGLTHIYNRATTKHLINERLKSNKTLDAFLLIDCDKFKLINDNFGHLEGDKALKNVSTVLRNNFKKTDIIGRIGGDEFCVYMNDVPSLDLVISKSESLISQIRSMSDDYDFTFSIGIKIRKDETTYEQLLKNADKALYQAKNMGGATVKDF
ncbi:MAG: GGDEF domain-containing protein [Sphaerochaetaceae bacterium]|nr:GGDEF domain-containing protein [Sphaerochaetaceae bacterium]